MDEIQSVKWMLGIFNPPVHMHTATAARMSLNGGRLVYHFEFVCMGSNLNRFFRYDSDLRKQGAGRPPAFGTTTKVIMSRLRIDCDLDPVSLAITYQLATGKIIVCPCLNTIVNGGMDIVTHMCLRIGYEWF